jgi:hypothetical protein
MNCDCRHRPNRGLAQNLLAAMPDAISCGTIYDA